MKMRMMRQIISLSSTRYHGVNIAIEYNADIPGHRRMKLDSALGSIIGPHSLHYQDSYAIAKKKPGTSEGEIWRYTVLETAEI